MFAAARVDKIRELLKEHKKVDVTTLVKVLSVSEATVRRDLEKLEQERFLQRTHGGAVLVEKEIEDTKVEIENYDEKVQIGKIAANFVNNNEVIFIGSGTTCFQFALNLIDKRDITIVTNNVLISTELYKYNNLHIVLTGGNIYSTENSISMVGEFTHNMIENIFVDKVFLGVSGVDIKLGFSHVSTELAEIWRKMSKISDELIILCDYTKFGKRRLARMGPLNIASKVVSNEQIDEVYKSYFYDNNIPIYTSYDI